MSKQEVLPLPLVPSPSAKAGSDALGIPYRPNAHKSLMGARSNCAIGMENPLSLPNGLVPVGTLIGCMCGCAE